VLVFAMQQHMEHVILIINVKHQILNSQDIVLDNVVPAQFTAKTLILLIMVIVRVVIVIVVLAKSLMQVAQYKPHVKHLIYTATVIVR
jgi:hypothetical protein